MRGDTIRFLIGDEHPLAHRAVSEALGKAPDLEMLGSVRTGGELLNLTLALNPRVVLVATQFPDMQGLDLIKHLREADSRLGIIVFTALECPDYLQSALILGANGYLLKRSVSLLAPAVRLVATSDLTVLPLELTARMASKATPGNLSSTQAAIQQSSPVAWDSPLGAQAEESPKPRDTWSMNTEQPPR